MLISIRRILTGFPRPVIPSILDPIQNLARRTVIGGLDLSVGALIDRPADPLSAAFYSFEIRDTFMFEQGQKVGIAVLFSEESKPRHDTIGGAAEPYVSMSEAQIKAIYGPPDTANIYTGGITYVGEKHIEYDFNSFTGCAGAVVFLLDKNQPSSVQQCDYGKAIVIHSGAHPFLASRNFGFMIRQHPAFS
jgi:hypothetical protein